MKEDAQLICPLAYEDPYGAWDHLNKELSPHFPLCDITWKSPQGSTIQVTCEKLSVRCIPSGANLFKDTDHPFRWFLAPYVNIYIFVCDTADSYKNRKTKLKQWIDALTGPKRSSWLVVYLPMGNQMHETYQKIYTKLSNEIYFDRVGDRTAAVYCNASLSSRKAHVADVVDKIKNGIITSFYQRCSLYDSEIRRLDAMRGTAQLDFRQLFLVKESLALMFQMMQLPAEALLQYEELENLLAFAPVESLPLTEWPFVPFESSSGSKGSKSSIGRSSSLSGKPENSVEGMTNESTDVVPVWMCVCQQGMSLLRYSINHARMKVLKNQIGVLELQHYIFSRICFFLFSLSRPAACAERAVTFLKSIRIKIQSKFDAIAEKELLDNSDATAHRRSVSMEQLNVVMLDGKDSTEGKDGFDNLNGVSMSVQRSNMADLWLIVSVVQLTKKCREELLTSLQNETPAAKAKASSPTISKKDALNRVESSDTDGGSAVTTASEENKNSDAPTSASSSFFNDESVGIKSKALARPLIELLTLARSKLSNLIYPGHRYRLVSLEMAQLFSRWDDYDSVVERFPAIFVGRNDDVSTADNSHCHPRVPIEETIPAFQKKIQTLMQYQSEFTQEELHSKSKLQQAQAENSSSRSTGGLFVSNVEISELEADISVIMLRLLIENEEIFSRWRFACHSILESADILITNGNFHLAKIYLRAALDGTVVSPDSVLSRSLTLQVMGTMTLWGQLRVCTLRKLLLCHRALKDGYNFILVSLSLLDPALQNFISGEFRQHLQHNVMEVVVKSPLVTDVQYHFQLHVQLKPPPEDMEGGHKLCPTMTMTKNTKKYIRDEIFDVNTATCIAGESHCVYFSITNHFPATILAKSVSIVYSPFIPVTVGSSETTAVTSSNVITDTQILKTNSHGIGGSSGIGKKSFVCVPYPEYFNEENMIVLQPGVTIVGMHFAPPCCGEFAPSEMNIQLNTSVTFVQKIIFDMNKLHPFFDHNILMDVVSPKQAVNIQPFPSTFTPIGHADVGGIFIIPKPADTITSMFIHAQCVAKRDRDAFNSMERTRKDSISLVSDRMSTATIAAVSAPATTSTSASAALGQTEASQQSGNSHFTTPSFQCVTLHAPKQWLFHCAPNSSDGSNVIDAQDLDPNIVVQNGGLLITQLPTNVIANLKVPFHTTRPDACVFDCFEVEEYDVIFAVEGQLIRNGCEMSFELQVEQTISVGDVFDISQESTELFGSEYFSQCVLRNISTIPWTLHNFVSSSPSSSPSSVVVAMGEEETPPGIGTAAFALVEELDDHKADTWKEVKVAETGVILMPGEAFHVAMHLRRTGDVRVDSGAVACLAGSFPIQRCFNGCSPQEEERKGKHDSLDILLANSIYKFYNTTMFMQAVSVCRPQVSPLVYSLDYQLRAFESTTPPSPSLAPGEQSAYAIGEPIPITYELDVLFPADSPTVQAVILVLSFACNQDWAVLGKTTQIVHCAAEDGGRVSLDIRLIAVSAGELSLPPLKITAFETEAQLQTSLRQTSEDRDEGTHNESRCDSLDILPEAYPIHVVHFQPTTSIFALAGRVA